MTDHLLVDIYSGDGDFDLQKLADAGLPWAGVMLKVTQGTYYNGGAWLERMWPAAKRCAGDRYGLSWFRLPYLYIDIGIDGVAQADYFLKRLAAVGGIGYGDACVVIDVERGGQRVPITKQRMIDVGAPCVAKLHQELGLQVVCYGGQLLRENQVTINDLGCKYGWVALYGSTLPPKHYESIGCDLEHLFAWQYAGLAGDGHVDAFVRGYPNVSPAGKVDISALTIGGGGDNALDVIRGDMCVTQPG